MPAMDLSNMAKVSAAELTAFEKSLHGLSVLEIAKAVDKFQRQHNVSGVKVTRTVTKLTRGTTSQTAVIKRS